MGHHSLKFYAHLRGVDIDKMSTQTQFQQWFRQLLKVAIENDCYGCITAEERMLRLYAPIVEEIRTSGRYNAFEKYVYQRLTRYKFRSGVDK